MDGWFNGEREFYVAGAIKVPLFVDGRATDQEQCVTASASADTTAAELTPQEQDICHRLGISEQDFKQVRADTLNRLKELRR